eukprot:300779-Pyramimonas_sp.AAC.1
MLPAPPSTAFSGPIGSSTEGPNSCDHMRPAPPSTAFRGPKRASTEGPSGTARMRPSRSFRHTPHMFRGRSRALRHSPHTVRGPIGRPTEGP